MLRVKKGSNSILKRGKSLPQFRMGGVIQKEPEPLDYEKNNQDTQKPKKNKFQK